VSATEANAKQPSRRHSLSLREELPDQPDMEVVKRKLAEGGQIGPMMQNFWL